MEDQKINGLELLVVSLVVLAFHLIPEHTSVGVSLFMLSIGIAILNNRL